HQNGLVHLPSFVHTSRPQPLYTHFSSFPRLRTLPALHIGFSPGFLLLQKQFESPPQQLRYLPLHVENGNYDLVRYSRWFPDKPQLYHHFYHQSHCLCYCSWVVESVLDAGWSPIIESFISAIFTSSLIHFRFLSLI